MATILIIEDDQTLRRVLRDNFASAGHRVETAVDGESGLDRALELAPDLVVLDIMLPGLNGFEICRELRRQDFTGGILMLTARVEDTDAILGLGIGADDYVRKPFNLRELLARAEALLRRTAGGPGEADAIVFGEFRIDRAARQLLRDGQIVELSPKEYDLLLYLAEHDGRALSRDQIMAAVWGYDARVTSRSIDRFVTTLRRKIEPDPRNPRHIQTIREFGYRFCSR